MMENSKVVTICNHCGGKLTMNGDILSCLMCGREADHLCDNCLIKPGQNADRDKKETKKAAGKSVRKAATKKKPVKAKR